MKDNYIIKNGVRFLTKEQDSFSEAYTKVREIEGRILTNEAVKRLPYPLIKNKNYQEWQLRQKSTERFISYLKNLNTSVSILDIGCGNGWFTNLMATVSLNNKVIGLDVSIIELEQAARVFNAENMKFVYGDLFKIKEEFENKFDIIIMNACVQYFPDFEALLLQLKAFLKPNGEVHIIDSPFYNPSEIEAAKKRTTAYYKSVDVSDMSANYFHHSKEKIKEFEVLYSPSKSFFRKIVDKKDSPFMWLRLRY